jgi:DnaJ-class molecular chaperone
MTASTKAPWPGGKNRIEKVEVQSETRAVVSAAEVEYSEQESPTKMQYILTREKGVWVIEDQLEWCSRCKGTGQQEDFEQRMLDIQRGVYTTHPTKLCTLCKGRGWISKLLQ